MTNIYHYVTMMGSRERSLKFIYRVGDQCEKNDSKKYKTFKSNSKILDNFFFQQNKKTQHLANKK